MLLEWIPDWDVSRYLYGSKYVLAGKILILSQPETTRILEFSEGGWTIIGAVWFSFLTVNSKLIS